MTERDKVEELISNVVEDYRGDGDNELVSELTRLFYTLLDGDIEDLLEDGGCTTDIAGEPLSDSEYQAGYDALQKGIRYG